MKSALQYLLLALALGLCVLVIVQWQRELQRQTELRDLKSRVGALRGELAQAEAEVARLDELKRRHETIAATNAATRQEWALQARNTANELERLTRQLAQVQSALDQANTNLAKQNVEMRGLAEERNAVVERFNRLATDYNELAARWNELQSRLATNSPAAH